MSVVIESAIGDENMLYPSMEQPENDALNDSRDVSKDDSNAMMEEQMSSSNDQVEDFPQKPQHIFVMDRESSLGKREHDSVFDRRASESSVSESSATSPRRHARSYGKKKQKLSARQRKRRLERSFGSDFKPGTIRHRLNFLQHNFGDQLTLIEESLPETFHRNMNLEIFIRNKMEQHEQHTSTENASVRRSPSFRRSPERQRKSSLKEMPGIKESAQEQTEQSEMAEIMTFAPRETPHFESSSSELETPDPSSAGHFSHAVDRSAREWRLSKFLEESPPPSPERKAITVEVPVEVALPEVPSLDESDVPALAAVEDAAVVAVPEPTSDVPTAVEEENEAAPSSAPVSSFSMVSATGIVETVPTTTEKTPKEAPFDEEPVVDSPVTEEAATPAPLEEEPVAEEMPATEEPQVEEPAAAEEVLEVVAATPKETEEPATPAVTEEVPKTEEPATPDVAAEVDAPEDESERDIAVAGNDGEVMEASTSSMPDLVAASSVEPLVASSDDIVEALAESVHEGVASAAEAPVMEASTSSMPDLVPTSAVAPLEAPSEDAVEAPAEPVQEVVASEPEAPAETIQEGVASEPEAPAESVDEGVASEPQTAVVDVPAEPVQEGVASEPDAPQQSVVEAPVEAGEGVARAPQTPEEGIVEAPAEATQEGVASESEAPEQSVAVAPTETVQEGVAGEPEAPQEEDPVSVQVKESASQIPDVGEDTPSRGESPQAQTKKAVQVAPEVKLEAPIVAVVVSEPEGVVSEPVSMGVKTPETAPQDAPAASTRDGVAQEESSNDNEAPAMTIETSSAPSDDSVVPSTPVADQSVSSASMESPKALDAVERARMEQATPVKAVASEATTPPTPDAVERARLEQQTPVKRKHEDATSDDAASKQPKAEVSDKADATDATDENKDSQNCPSPSSVMDTELGDGEGKVKKQCALKENRKLRFADELGKPLTKEHIIEREANYASRIVVMLLSPRDRKFEFLHAEYPLDESTTVQVLLEQVPLLATNDAFRTKKFNALLQTENSRQLDNALALQDYCFKESEIVLGIPDDFTVANMTKMAVPLLLNKKLMKTVKQAIRKGRGLKTVQSGVEWRK